MNKLVAILFASVITGCASTTGYRPTVDYYGDPRAAYLQQDDFECRQISDQNAGAETNTVSAINYDSRYYKNDFDVVG